MDSTIRIGTRESQLAVWQAVTVQQQLTKLGIGSELVYIKSEGDTNQVTPLYAMGVQGVFTKALDAALLNNEIDIAVHSMKDVPVQLAQGIAQAAVLERGNTADMFVWNETKFDEAIHEMLLQPAMLDAVTVASGDGFSISVSRQTAEKKAFVLATSSIRRKAQWLHHFPNSMVEDIRGNINTRMQKTQSSSQWHGAIFAAAGLNRIGLTAPHTVPLHWMLPAPAQGAIMVVCRHSDIAVLHQLQPLNHTVTDICTKAERDFLKTLLGGCSTPISALAKIENEVLHFEGSITKTDGTEAITIKLGCNAAEAGLVGIKAGNLLLENGGEKFVESFR